MLVFNLHPFLQIRGVTNPRRFLIDLGINHITAAKLLKGEMSSLRLEHVAKICQALRCTPNDLLEWVPDKNALLDAEHPLNKLASRKNIGLLLEKLGSMSYEDLVKLLQGM
ncbi:MAG TPA: hypothetical protein DDZ96_14155 [Porphyromonadaceae bacterium]|jgi:DNA-binding Xre family transcriptional regulator|uniref:helix-turn-helix domain-containing protein n=1 Tax=Limibacterium fermenti TaxID=3229863 RepID=UPI000E80C89C|nr:hypothetical protein [Porphyromonadaceae bacterium]HBK30399.1 hypothetical protein [Porphyromonadaceae bacterium]HBL34934.1 hypothetical protein [Porphyromonadaceae bacterium]HBX46929.1 hypothetical protein [Porphyromonadaceae bacterium]